MHLIACDPLLGLPRVPPENGPRPDLADLRAEMVRLRLSGALVRHRAGIDNAPYWGNQTLMAELQGAEDLVPVWVLTPDGDEPAFDPAVTVRAMLAGGGRAAWMSPTAHAYSLAPWCSGDLYAALAAARVPLLLSWQEITADHLHAICAAFPDLRVILFRVARMGRNRSLYPLLCRHPNLYVTFDPFFSVFQGFRDLCDRFGPDRWVFGTGYPDAEGGSGITGLLYAGLTDAELDAVGHATIERLLGEVDDDF